MLESITYMTQQNLNQVAYSTHANGSQFTAQFTAKAYQMFLLANMQARITRFWAALTGRSRRLIDLNTLADTHQVHSQRYAGIQTISLKKIRGSEGRSDDFDADFNPVHANSKSRWMRVAEAMLQDIPLPLVELIQVGDTYFVRDGHHRISVARMLGQEAIEAEVTILQTNTALSSQERPCCLNLAATAA